MFGSSIWLAYSSHYKSNVAIKVISKVSAPPEYMNKFLPREIAFLKILTHPNLIYEHEIFETYDRVFIVMEFAENGDLFEMVKSEKFIVEPVAGRWFHQLIDGIEYCHSNGIVHQNLKCENLLLDKRYNLKITDFAFAEYCKKKMKNTPPKLGNEYCGSYAYACPEIVFDVPYDPMSADIFSCGVILAIMVFGRQPFDDSNYSRLFIQMKNLPPIIPLTPIVSHDCCYLIKKLLIPEKRRLDISEIRYDPWFRRIYPFFGPRLRLAKHQECHIWHPFNVH